jgi:hypothetical protein
MDSELKLTIVLERPTAGCDYGLQKGKGNDYETVCKRSKVQTRI